jgi:beta-glucanase (GH16 family)
MLKKMYFFLTLGLLVVVLLMPQSGLALDSGYHSPAAQAAGPGGDGNGFEVSPTSAFANDGVFAADMLSGTAATLDCMATTRDRHDFFNYGFAIPAGSTIAGIEVRLDAKVDNPVNEKPALCVQLSSDGGATWTTAKSTAPVLTTSEVTYLLGGAADAWGRTWTDANFSNTNFRVRVTSVAYSAYRHFYLDWAAVKVYYGGSGPTATNTSIPPTSTSTAVGPTNTPTNTNTPAPATPTPSGNWQLVWSDEFNGPAIDTSNWNFDIGDGGQGAKGWWNDEMEWYTSKPENVRIENGALIIEARHELNGQQCWYGPCEYTSAKVTTLGKRSFQYGKIEARMRLPYGNGMWPAFWTMGNNFNTVSWPQTGELDIMEMVGGDQCGFDCADNMTHGYMHWARNGKRAISAGTNSPPLAQGIYADAYHVFGIEWDAQEIRWYVDGQQYYSHTIVGDEYTEFHQPHWFMINLAIGGVWGGNPTPDTVFPQKMYIDWVRVWQQ